MGRLQDKIALVSGGASGIGEASVRRFVAEGARVVIADLNADKGRELARSLGAPANFVPLDATAEDSWLAAIEDVRRLHGRLDILVNSAGISVPADIETAEFAHWRHTHKVNADSVFLGCKHGLSLLKETTRAGAIVNLASTLGLRPQPGFIAYDSSKASVWAVTRAVALHCCQKGYPIRVNSVHPGATLTPMMQGYLDAAPDRDAMLAMFAANHPMNRVGTPEELANAVLFLASDEASFITGVALPVDGGYCAM
jgi:3(or 17)beta-hydroxysteroid dehydrogenase